MTTNVELLMKIEVEIVVTVEVVTNVLNEKLNMLNSTKTT